MPLYSEEIEDIMGRIPGRILRIGLLVIFIIIFSILLGSYFIKSPDIVSCPIVLTTINSPQEIYVRTTEKISHLEVHEHDTVMPGSLIAILHNTAKYEDIQKLEFYLKKLDQSSKWDSIVRNTKFPENLFVGDIQASYLSMYNIWKNYNYYLSQGYLPLKISLQEEQINKARTTLQNLLFRQRLQKQDFELEQKQYVRDSNFYMLYPEAVSAVEYEKKTQSYLQKQVSFLNFCSIVDDTRNEILKKEEQLIDLKIQYDQELHNFRQQIFEAYKLLYENFKQWHDKYILVSNIAGVVTFTNYWSVNQTVISGDILATIIPLEKTQIIGRAFVDMKGIGKVKQGHAVNIKLNGFPYMEFGMLKGTVKHVSLVPDKHSGYIAEISLINGLQSSYQKHLKFIQKIEGTAEIITENKSLLTRVIEPLKFKLSE